MKVKCAWMMCKHNTSNKAGTPGECTMEQIELRHIDNEDTHCEECDEIIEGLVCTSYDYDKERVYTIDNHLVQAQ